MKFPTVRIGARRVGTNQFGHQEVIGKPGVALADQGGRRDRLGEGTDPLEAPAVEHHRVADPPQEMESESAVLAPTVVVDTA